MKFEKKVEQLRIQKYGGKESKEFLNDVIAMANGEPLEYLLGEVRFCNAVVDLSLRPMIPRLETEYWVYQVINECKNQILEKGIKNFKGLDLFSGSGNVGIALLKNIEDSHVTMVEIDERLKKQIEISLIKNRIDPQRVIICTGDTWGNICEEYDVITAVPPYVPPSMIDEVMNDLHAEPQVAFFDKEDGFFYHKQILHNAKKFLKEGGVLYLEFDITQRQAIEDLVTEEGFSTYSFLRDPYHHEFVVKVVKEVLTS